MKNIAILSVPRSGSTWLGQIFNSSPHVLYRFQPNFAYSFPLSLSKDSSRDEIERFHKELLKCDDPFVTGRLSISGKEPPQFLKSRYAALVWKEVHCLFLSHTLLKNSDTYVVGLIRSPLSTIASWINVPKEFDPEWSVSEEWFDAPRKNEGKQSNYFGYKKWKEVALLFERLIEEYPGRFYLLTYDNLLRQTTETVTELFQFVGLELSDQTKAFLNNSRSKSDHDAYGVFKTRKKDDGWRTKLPMEVIQYIQEDLRGTSLEKYI